MALVQPGQRPPDDRRARPQRVSAPGPTSRCSTSPTPAAPYNLTGSEQYYATQPEADAAMFKAGLDSYTADDNDPGADDRRGQGRAGQGLLDEADVDTAVRHALNIRVPARRVRPGRRPVRRHQAGRGQHPGAPAAGPQDRRRGDRAAEERRPHAAADAAATKRRGDRPAGEHGLHRLVLRHPALPGHPARRHQGAAGAARRRPPPRAQTASRCGTPQPAIRHRDRLGATTPRDGDRRRRRRRPRSSTSSTGARASSRCATPPTASTSRRARARRRSSPPTRSPTAGTCSSSSSSRRSRDGSSSSLRGLRDAPRRWFGAEQLRDGRRGRQAACSARPRAAARGPLRQGPGLRDGIDSAVEAAAAADTAVVVVGSMPFINGREAHDRTTMALGASQQALVKAVRQANPHTVVVLENSYPDHASPGSSRTYPRSCGPRTPARRPATRSPTCCSATSTRPAG